MKQVHLIAKWVDVRRLDLLSLSWFNSNLIETLEQIPDGDAYLLLTFEVPSRPPQLYQDEEPAAESDTDFIDESQENQKISWRDTPTHGERQVRRRQNFFPANIIRDDVSLEAITQELGPDCSKDMIAGLSITQIESSKPCFFPMSGIPSCWNRWGDSIKLTTLMEACRSQQLREDWKSK